MWWRVSRVVRAATDDDGTGAVWPRLTPDGRTVLDLAFAEARELGHPCMAGEHVLLGLLRHGTSPAAVLLRARGLDLDSARAGVRHAGPALGPGASPAVALRALGIDADEVRPPAAGRRSVRITMTGRVGSHAEPRPGRGQIQHERDHRRSGRPGCSRTPARGEQNLRTKPGP